MRVLQVLQPPDGGVPEHVRHLGEGLLARGHDVTVVAPAGASCRGPLRAAGARFVAAPLRPELGSVREDLAAAKVVREVVERERPDVVHTHAQKAGMVGRAVALRAGIPAVYTPHSFVYRTQLLRPRRSARARFVVGREVERALGRRSAAVVAVSEEERHVAVQDGLVARPGQVHLIPNGVRVDPAVPAGPELVAFAQGEPLLGFVAGLRDQKGLPHLLDALELLADRGALPRTAIVGNGPEEGLVRERLRDPRLRDRVGLFPFSPPVEKTLNAFDVYVLPSLWEGLPLGLLEAMLCGVAPIATTVGGSPDAIDDGRTGFLVPPAEPEPLAAAIERATTDAALRERVAAAAREDARARFTVDLMVDRVEALYLEVAR